jgi:competence protein ComEC
VNDTLNRAGLSHLIAISGYNVTLIAGFTIGALGWLLGRRRAALVAVPVVLAYAVFVGASPPVLRAALMGALMLGALLAGRPGSAGTAVALAGAAMVAIEPLAMDDVSFQMSFLATLGLVYLSEPIARLLEGGLVGRVPAGLALWASETAGVTLAASLAVLPVTAAAFGRVSLVALPANLAVLPLFPLMLLTSALTALAGAVWAPLGDAIGLIAEAAIGYLTAAAAFFAGLPLATLSVDDFGSREAILFYAAAAGVAGLLPRFVRPAAREEETRATAGLPLLAAAVVAAAAIAVWTGAFAPSPRLTVLVLDVGQGDAIFMRTPAGHRILVDGGPGGERLAQALGPHLRPGEGRLDLVVLTHPQDDHVTGLVEALRRFEVGLVIAPPTESDTAAFAAFRSEIVTQGVPVRAAHAGERVDLGRGAWLEVLAPPEVLLVGTSDDLNNNSMVLRLGLGGVSFLLTGDMAEPGERALLNSPDTVRATVLKVGHHGSDGSTSEALLQAVRPAAAVVSAGATNPFGHPSPTTLRRLAGIPLYSTMANGNVRFETDGRRLWSQPERGGARLIDLAGGR